MTNLSVMSVSDEIFYDTGCLLVSDWSKIIPLCNVSAAAGPCIQKSTFNQSELV